MPTTRKSARGSTATGQQSMLRFQNRVTKNIPRSAKDSVRSSSITKKVDPPTPGEKVKRDEKHAVPNKSDKSDAEAKAEKISDAQIKRYWKDLEAQRRAKRVHQEGLSLSEKVLRYFDVSSQYGPCIGITRAKRWHRADKLGLSPPVEVLAVLLQEEKQGNNEVEKATMDSIMGSTAVGGI